MFCNHCKVVSAIVKSSGLISLHLFFLLKRNTASGRSPACVCGSDPPCFSMWDSILLSLERSKNSQWVSQPHSHLFAETLEATSCIEMLSSSLCVSRRTKTSWSHYSTRCTSTPQLRFQLQWRYRGNVSKKRNFWVFTRPKSDQDGTKHVLCHTGVSGSHTREDILGRGLLLGHHSYCRRLRPVQIWQTCQHREVWVYTIFVHSFLSFAFK